MQAMYPSVFLLKSFETRRKGVNVWLRTALNICAAFVGKSKCPSKAAGDQSLGTAQEIHERAEALTAGR